MKNFTPKHLLILLLLTIPVFSQQSIPVSISQKAIQLASDIDDVVAIVTTWMKTSLKKDITQDQIINVQAIATQFFLIDTDPNLKFERVWYLIATAQWESGLSPIEEGRSHNYGSNIWDIQNRYFYTGFQGRGFSQVTWRARY
jgi:hypothetical protein